MKFKFESKPFDRLVGHDDHIYSSKISYLTDTKEKKRFMISNEFSEHQLKRKRHFFFSSFIFDNCRNSFEKHYVSNIVEDDSPRSNKVINLDDVETDDRLVFFSFLQKISFAFSFHYETSRVRSQIVLYSHQIDDYRRVFFSFSSTRTTSIDK